MKKSNNPLINDNQLKIQYINVRNLLSNSHANLSELSDSLAKLADRAIEIADKLTCKDIALIFNLVSQTKKMSLLKLMEPRLERLSKYVLEKIDKFGTKDIAMISNLISKFDNVNNNKTWQSLVPALGKRALAICAQEEALSKHLSECELEIQTLKESLGHAYDRKLKIYKLEEELSKYKLKLEKADKFNEQGIAMICNLLSKLDNVNDSEWQLLLQALFRRALAIIDKFGTQGIAMMFNLMSKLNNVKDEKSQSIIEALSQRALAICALEEAILQRFSECTLEIHALKESLPAPDREPTLHMLEEELSDLKLELEKTDKFNAQGIAMIFNMISKLANVNDEKWQPLLEALSKRVLKICALEEALSEIVSKCVQEIRVLEEGASEHTPKRTEEISALKNALSKHTSELEKTDKFSAQGIAMIFNMISKLAKVNDEKWQPILKALSKRALKVADQFTAQQIAMIFNLISKLESVNDSQWRPLLQALAQRAFAVANEFKPEGIAMVFNLISKLDDVNSPEWRPLLLELAKRALVMANEFKPEGIAMVFNLISKLESVDRQEWQFIWQPLLRTLGKRALMLCEREEALSESVSKRELQIQRLEEVLVVKGQHDPERRELTDALAQYELEIQALEWVDKFQAQQIAMIFNLISKLDVNSPEWRPLLRALSKRALVIASNKSDTAYKFEPKTIAMMFNSISKLDSINDPEWRPLLLTLAQRALSMANKFVFEGIAMVSNLILKLGIEYNQEWLLIWEPLLEALMLRALAIANNKRAEDKFNAPEIVLIFSLALKLKNANSEIWQPTIWQPLLEKLLDCSLEIANEFEEHHIAIIQDLVSKLNNSNSQALQPQLKALQEYFKQRWDEFNNRLALTKNDSNKLNGKVTNKFSFEYIKYFKSIHHKIALDKLGNLGNVDISNPANYFEVSDEVKQLAMNFLTVFWYNKEYLESTIKLHHEKCRIIFQGQEIQSSQPYRISFIALKIADENLCLIVTSAQTSQQNNHISAKLRQFTNEYTYQNTKFLVPSISNINNFHKIIKLLTNDDHECAIRIYTNTLTNLFLMYGNRVKITGVVSCSFFPYEKDKHDDLVKPLPNSPTVVGEKYLFKFVPSCQACMKHKPAVLTMLSAAQHFRSTQSIKNKKTKSQNKPTRIKKIKENKFVSLASELHAEEEKSPVATTISRTQSNRNNNNHRINQCNNRHNQLANIQSLYKSRAELQKKANLAFISLVSIAACVSLDLIDYTNTQYQLTGKILSKIMSRELTTSNQIQSFASATRYLCSPLVKFLIIDPLVSSALQKLSKKMSYLPEKLIDITDAVEKIKGLEIENKTLKKQIALQKIIVRLSFTLFTLYFLYQIFLTKNGFQNNFVIFGMNIFIACAMDIYSSFISAKTEYDHVAALETNKKHLLGLLKHYSDSYGESDNKKYGAKYSYVIFKINKKFRSLTENETCQVLKQTFNEEGYITKSSGDNVLIIELPEKPFSEEIAVLIENNLNKRHEFNEMNKKINKELTSDYTVLEKDSVRTYYMNLPDIRQKIANDDLSARFNNCNIIVDVANKILIIAYDLKTKNSVPQLLSKIQDTNNQHKNKTKIPQKTIEWQKKNGAYSYQPEDKNHDCKIKPVASTRSVPANTFFFCSTLNKKDFKGHNGFFARFSTFAQKPQIDSERKKDQHIFFNTKNHGPWGAKYKDEDGKVKCEVIENPDTHQVLIVAKEFVPRTYK